MARLNDQALAELAGQAGLLVEWEGWDGQRHTVAPDTLRAALRALDLPCDSQADAVESRKRLHLDEPPASSQKTTTAITMAELTGRERSWGLAAQIHSLRDESPTELGDFAALSQLARVAAARGTDALAVSPVHALFLADPERYSPYSPSSRDYLNPLLADCGTGKPGGDLIDWADASSARQARLRSMFDQFEGDAAFDAFVAAGGSGLREHALFEALDSHFHARGSKGGWQSWPSAFQDPSSASVATFAREYDREIRLHLFMQWRADHDLAAAQEAALSAGMRVGLIADLAVGIDPGGSHAWGRRDELLHGLTLGAPPDAFQADGQGWGITGLSPTALRRTNFAPFVRTIRAALAHAGGVRIDHALGLGRLWVIPEGATPMEGVYLRQPLDDLLRLLAAESRRSRALVIAEDLGVVPPGMRAKLVSHHLLGMRVLAFERDEHGRFTDPATWTPEAVALTSTHDLPPVAGWWRGTDIEWRQKLGFRGDTHTQRTVDRWRFWDAAGCGSAPHVEEPGRAVDAAVGQVARSACELAIIPLEDLTGCEQASNLPGTVDEHPNWRRRMGAAPEQLLAAPDVSHRLNILNRERPR